MAGFEAKISERAAKFNTFQEVVLSVLQDLDEDHASLFVMLIWKIWRTRNDILWERRFSSAAQVVSVAKSQLLEWQAACFQIANERSASVCSKWHPPPSTYWKLNVDGAFFQDSLQMGIGMILRDEHGGFVDCRTFIVEGFYDADEGEAMGLYEALSWIKYLGYERVKVEVYAKVVADAVNSYKHNMSTFGDYISRCRSLLMECPNFSVSFIRRNVNELAHRLARESRTYSRAPTVG